MKTLPLLAALALGSALSVASAQTATPAQKPAAKPKAAAPAKPAAPAPVVLPEADAEQLAAADQAHIGDYACEFNQSIDIEKTPAKAGYVDVKYNKMVYTMKPVLSSTGALRLEDVKGQTLMLQIANKSMLMDVKAGKRLVDGCMHEKQRAVAAALAAGTMNNGGILGGK